jgi:DedD protein
MALFQLRKKVRDDAAAPPAPAQTVEAMRRRAIHRLIGAAVLVVAGVIGFPLFFDSQPRPIPVDLPIIIPEKGRQPALATPPANPALAAASAPARVAEAPAKPAAVETPSAVPPAAEKPAPAAAPVAAATPTPVPPQAPAAATAEADKARALLLLEGKEPSDKPAAAAGEARFIVQVGAFTDAAKVREVRRKVEALGMKTYTQVVETKEGSRIRVRIGPFTDKAEAARMADKIRKLDLSPAILTL